MYCSVITAAKNPGISDGLTYSCDETVRPGQHVRVPLRQSIVDAVVLDVCSQSPQTFEVKPIHGVVCDAPMLSSAQIATLKWMSEHYLCTLRQALSAWLPSKKWKDLHLKSVDSFVVARTDVRGTKQLAVLEVLSGSDGMSIDRIRDESGASLATIRSMIESGVLTRKSAPEFTPRSRIMVEPSLTPDQLKAKEIIDASTVPTLLYGVTGSGKTEVYAALIHDCAKRGEQSILLVPEILLTEHCIGRFQELLGADAVSVLHSKITETQKLKEWRKIRSGAALLVIGSRSALFAPTMNLKLVIIDEEHEWTYKNEQTPRYHARQTAHELCKNAGAKLVLGSATPSLESWLCAHDGAYAMAAMPKRFNDAPMPTIRIVDMADVQWGDRYPFTNTLIDAIQERLKRREQSILFLNRRGIASALLCRGCRRRIVSARSQLPFTVHKSASGRPYLLDHSTGDVSEIPGCCPSCNSTDLLTVGAGTQGLEELTRRLFPTARILRADKDTLTTPEDIRALLEAMRSGEADILLGTQSVVKGLDLPNVTLSAVVLADVGLSLPHFRAGERTFQLLTQLAGRSGRSKPGEVIIQTFRPSAPEIALAAEHKTDEYLNLELKIRTHTKYPPFTDMIRILFRGDDAESAASVAKSKLEHVMNDQKLACVVFASKTLYEGPSVWQVLLRGADAHTVLRSAQLGSGIVDVDPMSCL